MDIPQFLHPLERKRWPNYPWASWYHQSCEGSCSHGSQPTAAMASFSVWGRFWSTWEWAHIASASLVGRYGNCNGRLDACTSGNPHSRGRNILLASQLFLHLFWRGPPLSRVPLAFRLFLTWLDGCSSHAMRCQDNYNSVVMSLHCSCSCHWLDKKNKSHVCPSIFFFSGAWLCQTPFVVSFISWNLG